MCCGLEIILERIKVTFLSKPAKFGQAQTAKLLIGDTELKGVPESCLRGSRAAWPDVGLTKSLKTKPRRSPCPLEGEWWGQGGSEGPPRSGVSYSESCGA